MLSKLNFKLIKITFLTCPLSDMSVKGGRSEETALWITIK
jgi:hypothetical protein